ncbi:unnamed protein product [Dimorphilus gyrociliatus]|uniref:Uncharacterized protein n=1 Tax=Dimorphilus gyrociliatus TaxID=2664684 RepID=A0A7I8VWX4_9ANNE|nr:unnamed protein product [Dimorphilus gyrociliatus]
MESFHTILSIVRQHSGNVTLLKLLSVHLATVMISIALSPEKLLLNLRNPNLIYNSFWSWTGSLCGYLLSTTVLQFTGHRPLVFVLMAASSLYVLTPGLLLFRIATSFLFGLGVPAIYSLALHLIKPAAMMYGREDFSHRIVCSITGCFFFGHTLLNILRLVSAYQEPTTRSYQIEDCVLGLTSGHPWFNYNFPPSLINPVKMETVILVVTIASIIALLKYACDSHDHSFDTSSGKAVAEKILMGAAAPYIMFNYILSGPLIAYCGIQSTISFFGLSSDYLADRTPEELIWFQLVRSFAASVSCLVFALIPKFVSSSTSMFICLVTYIVSFYYDVSFPKHHNYELVLMFAIYGFAFGGSFVNLMVDGCKRYPGHWCAIVGFHFLCFAIGQGVGTFITVRVCAYYTHVPCWIIFILSLVAYIEGRLHYNYFFKKRFEKGLLTPFHIVTNGIFRLPEDPPSPPKYEDICQNDVEEDESSL